MKGDSNGAKNVADRCRGREQEQKDEKVGNLDTGKHRSGSFKRDSERTQNGGQKDAKSASVRRFDGEKIKRWGSHHAFLDARASRE